MTKTVPEHATSPIVVWMVGVTALVFTAAAVAPDGWRRVLTVILIIVAGVLGPLALARRSPWKQVGLTVTVSCLVVAIAVATVPGPKKLADTTTTDPRAAEASMQACRENHGLKARQATGSGIHGACVWPPAPGARADGYSEVVVKGYVNGESNADEDAVAWRFTSACEHLRIEWDDFKSGTRATESPVQDYANGQTLSRAGTAASLRPGGDLDEGTLTAEDLVIITTDGSPPGQVACV